MDGLKCPWCEKYIKVYLRDDGIFFKQELEEKERLNAGFWASIKDVHDEQYLANKILTVETALKMGMPIQIDMENREKFFGRFWCYSLAEARAKVLKKELKHFWIQSGLCSIHYMTPICCELANFSSGKEQIEWEMEEFVDLKSLTEKLANHLKEEEWQ